MYSSIFFNFATCGYFCGLGIFALNLVKTKRTILGIGIFLVAFSFLAQTGGMVCRWIEAGHLEVLALEKALGVTLTGWSWFVVFTQHPPWSNLYEILVYMSWGLILVTLALEMKWHMPFLRHMGLIFTLIALGLASLTDATIKPLVPALKSWWIMIHVISASVAYAAGALAAVICFLALVKDIERVKRPKLIGISLAFSALLLFFLGGGSRLFLEQAYFVKLLAIAGDTQTFVMDMSKQNGAPFFVPMPTLGYLFIFAIIAHVICGSVIIYKKEFIKIGYVLCFFTVFILLFLALLLDAKKSNISLSGSIVNHLQPPGPWFVSFKSHTWSLGLLILLFIFEFSLLFIIFSPKQTLALLPEVSTLENNAYKSICLAFFLMTIVLITGALWAHYAWGRYWAWDPKETGALAIWLNYAIYLHTKRTKGLSGPASSFIGIMGFFVIILGFLGVNLGLFADGLHTYGNS